MNYFSQFCKSRLNKGKGFFLQGRQHWLALFGILFVTGCTGVASAQGLITGNYQLNWDQSSDKTESGTTDVKKLKQTLELKYRGFLSPVVANRISFKVAQEVNSDASDVIRLLPTLELGVKAKYWDVRGGSKRTYENSDELGKNPKTTDSYFGELFYIAPKRIPDVKVKYTVDVDKEEDRTDTRKDGITLSSVYNPTGWLSAKGEYTRNVFEDKLNANSDTEDEKSNGTLELRHAVSDVLKARTQYTTEVARAATLKSDGTGAVEGSAREDLTNTWKNTVSFRPFEDTSVDGSYDYDLKQNKVKGQHTLTGTSKITIDQKMGKPFEVKGDFSRITTEMAHTPDDNKKTEDTWTGEFYAKFSRQFDFAFKYQKKTTVENHADPTKSLSSGSLQRNVTWNSVVTTFWTGSINYIKTDTLTFDVVTLVSERYSIKSKFEFKAIRLTLEPIYDIDMKTDLVKSQDATIRDFKTRIAQTVLSTRTIVAKYDHIYGRKTDALAANTQRTDITNANIAWNDPIPGWLLSFDAIRLATDTSGDDLPPDISSTFGMKVDYKRDQFMISTSYKYDKKSLTDNSETLDAKTGWTAPSWDASITYTYKKTFSVVPNEGYTLSLAFKYNL